MSDNIEFHPLAPFLPNKPKKLIIGSFPGKEQTQTIANELWYYGAKRNQFWKIMEGVYQVPLNNPELQKNLFEKEGIAITDVIYAAKRRTNTNLDNNLEIVAYNENVLHQILNQYSFEQIFFTSKFVEYHFHKKLRFQHPGICLPSPSPRFAKISIDEKINIYKLLFNPS